MFLVQIWIVPFRSSGTPVEQIQSSVDGYASAMQPEVGQISARGVRFGACFADYVAVSQGLYWHGPRWQSYARWCKVMQSDAKCNFQLGTLYCVKPMPDSWHSCMTAGTAATAWVTAAPWLAAGPSLERNSVPLTACDAAALATCGSIINHNLFVFFCAANYLTSKKIR